MWQITKPGTPRDLETFSDEKPAGGVIAARGAEALALTEAAFEWPEMFGGANEGGAAAAPGAEQAGVASGGQPAPTAIGQVSAGGGAAGAPVEQPLSAEEQAELDAALEAAVPALLSAGAGAGPEETGTSAQRGAAHAEPPLAVPAHAGEEEELAAVAAALEAAVPALVAAGAGGPSARRAPGGARLRKVDRVC